MDYQRRLETAAYIKMAVIMAVSGLAFITAPSRAAFTILHEHGLTLFPTALGLLCLAGMAGYILLLADGQRHRRSARTLRTLFLVCSFPIAAYMTTLGYIQVSRGMGFAALGYLLVYAVIFLLAFAIFNGYSRLLEALAIIVLATFLFLAAGSFIYSPPSFFRMFNLSPMGFTLLCLLGSLGYSLLFHPRIRALSIEWKHLWFIVSEVPIPLFALFTAANALRTGGSGTTTISLLGLYLLIALLGHALYRPQPQRAR